jgi:hypothetical protein
MTAARDPIAVFREAVALAQQGEYEAALQNHLWFHEHALEHEPALAGVRLSFALAHWVELGEKYPKALQALTTVRDERIKTLAEGKGSFQTFHDLAAINDYLNESPGTVAVFKQIHQAHPELAAQCFGVAQAHLVAQREYTICACYIPEALAWFEEIRQLFQMQMEIADENPVLAAGGVREHAKASFMREVGQLMEILVGVGRRREAQRVGELALEVNASAELRDAVARALGHQEPGA